MYHRRDSYRPKSLHLEIAGLNREICRPNKPLMSTGDAVDDKGSLGDKDKSQKLFSKVA